MFLLLKTEDSVFARLTIMAKNLVIFFIIMFAMTTVTTFVFWTFKGKVKQDKMVY